MGEFLKAIAAVLVLVGIMAWFIAPIQRDSNVAWERYKSARHQCLQKGYPEIAVQFNHFYCQRKVAGSDEMLEVEP